MLIVAKKVKCHTTKIIIPGMIDIRVAATQVSRLF